MRSNAARPGSSEPENDFTLRWSRKATSRRLDSEVSTVYVADGLSLSLNSSGKGVKTAFPFPIVLRPSAAVWQERAVEKRRFIVHGVDQPRFSSGPLQEMLPNRQRPGLVSQPDFRRPAGRMEMRVLVETAGHQQRRAGTAWCRSRGMRARIRPSCADSDIHRGTRLQRAILYSRIELPKVSLDKDSAPGLRSTPPNGCPTGRTRSSPSTSPATPRTSSAPTFSTKPTAAPRTPRGIS